MLEKMPLSRRTLIAFREAFVDWTLAEIRDEFDAAGVEPDFEYVPPEINGQRRTLVEQYYRRLDVNRPNDEHTLCEVFASVLLHSGDKTKESLVVQLERDGFAFDGRKIRAAVGDLETSDLVTTLALLDASHLEEHIERIRASVTEDPPLAVGAAKELIEAVCKTILLECDRPVDDNPDIPELVQRVGRELELLPDGVPEGVKGEKAIRRVLGSLVNMARGLAELRNLYGSGHGRDGRWRGITPRHARLAAGSAATLTTFLVETYLARVKERDLR